MDPTACWKRWQEAVEDLDIREAREAHQDLMTWLARGGFPPKWSKEEENEFYGWDA